MNINYIQKIEAELVVRGQSWSHGGGVGQVGAELVARGEVFSL